MSDQNSPPPPQRRRSSFVDMFTSRPSIPNANNAPQNPVSSSPPTAAAAVPPSPNPPQHRRGTSITALGLTTNTQSQTSPFNAFARQRRASVATSSSGSPEFRNSFGDEPAVLEDDETGKSPTNNSPLGRRLSFGAQALRDVKQSGPGSPGAGRRPSSSLFTLSENSENLPPQSVSPKQGGSSSGTAKTRGKSQGLSLCRPRVLFQGFSPPIDTDSALGEGFNWSDALRDRTKRSPSFSGNPFSSNTTKPRTTTAAAPEPPKEMPKPAEPVMSRMKKPDHLGERMLRGDFMMD